MHNCKCREVASVLVSLKAGIGMLNAAFFNDDKIGGFVDKTLQEVNDDLDTLNANVRDYVKARDDNDAARDAVDVDLRKQVADGVAQHVTDKAALDALQPLINSAFDKAEAARAQIVAPAPPVLVDEVPTGNTPAAE